MKKSVDVIHKELEQLEKLCRQNINAQTVIQSHLHKYQQLVSRSKESSKVDIRYKLLSALLTLLKCLLIVLLVVVMIIFLTSFLMNTWIQKFVLSYSQELIYPVMRQIRLWTLPLIAYHSKLKSLHVEECLLSNPFFIGLKTDCWTCRYTFNVADLTNNPELTRDHVLNSKPFTIKNSGQFGDISLELVRRHVSANSEALDFGTASLSVNKSFDNEINATNLFGLVDSSQDNADLHLAWRFNRVESARVWRKLFPRPVFVPRSTEVSLEKYLFLDGSNATSYQLPSTQFANVWLTQLNGPRIFTFRPSFTCRLKCRTFSLLLDHGDVLYYNWLLWSVWSLPVNKFSPDTSSNLAVTYVNSFY